jgi:hypothetical protein
VPIPAELKGSYLEDEREVVRDCLAVANGTVIDGNLLIPVPGIFY